LVFLFLLLLLQLVCSSPLISSFPFRLTTTANCAF
jgi:hypothetical protein